MNKSSFFWLVFVLMFFVACKKASKDEVGTVYPWQRNYSNMGALPRNTTVPITIEGFELGKQLFYDARLSLNGKVSCATCHLYNRAFADHDVLSTSGVSGKPLARHTPVLFNLAWHSGYFWDGGANNLQSLVFGPLTHPDEMGMEVAHALEVLKNDPKYVQLFNEQYPQSGITSKTFSYALTQFMWGIVSANSKYDAYSRKESGPAMTDLELKGLEVFKSKCSTCHSTDLFSDYLYHNTGLELVFSSDPEDPKRGRNRITSREDDLGKFKTATLRNVAVTPPYMHDGRFSTLQEVLNHYRYGLVKTDILDKALIQNGKPGIDLSDEDCQALIAFLNTLTDHEFLTSKVYSNP